MPGNHGDYLRTQNNYKGFIKIPSCSFVVSINSNTRVSGKTNTKEGFVCS